MILGQGELSANLYTSEDAGCFHYLPSRGVSSEDTGLLTGAR